MPTPRKASKKAAKNAAAAAPVEETQPPTGAALREAFIEDLLQPVKDSVPSIADIESPEPTPEPALDPRELWSRCVAEVQARKPLMGVFVAQGVGIEIRDGDLFVGFAGGAEMARSALSKPASIDALNGIVAALSGRPTMNVHLVDMEDVDDGDDGLPVLTPPPLEVPKRKFPPGKSILRRIKNLHRSFGEETHYIAGTLCDEDGQEFSVLLTESELKTIRTRAAGNEADIACAPPLID